jgi:hypothetical protein
MQYSVEDIMTAANILLEAGLERGFKKMTDKYKWREVIMGELMKHHVFAGMSGNKSADASNAGKLSEYKTITIDEDNYKRMNGIPVITKKGKPSKQTSVFKAAVYNGAMNAEVIESYRKIDHYFGLFYRERPIKIYKVDSNFVSDRLLEGLIGVQKRVEKGGSTNLNLVHFDTTNLDTNFFTEVYSFETNNDIASQ